MGSLYRSHEMTYCQILASPEAIYNVVAALGEHCMVQFKDVITNLLSLNLAIHNCFSLFRKLPSGLRNDLKQS